MIIHDVQQGSGEWLALRAGIPTASAFDQVITSKWKVRTGNMPETYMDLLAAEQLLGEPLDDFSTSFTERGQLLEADAIPWYEMTQDVDVERVGFITNDEKTVGCSPDGLVGKYGMIEIKAPAALTKSAAYMKAIRSDEADAAEPYHVQVHGELWVTGREWCDLIFYHSRLPKRIIRIHRDEAIIEKIKSGVLPLSARLVGVVERVRAMM